MKRADNLFDTLISDENLKKAIDTVNKKHHWIKKHHRPNLCTAWVEETKEERIKELKQIIINGFVQKKPRISVRWDASAQKYRTISEPVQYPDQYVHHALIQVLQPVMMKGMDYYCCGSIRGRGPDREQKAIKHWMAHDIKGTKYEFCADIYHFYDSLKPEVVMERMKQLIKDSRALDLIWRIIKDGILIGAFPSQWFANTTLQPLDRLIRESGLCKRYCRYMDNITIFGSNKRHLLKLRRLVETWLNEHELWLKGDHQIFRVKKLKSKEPLTSPRQGFTRPEHRLPDAVGYRYGRGFTLIRKHALLRLKRSVARYRRQVRKGKRIAVKTASSVISRLGLLAHCSNHNIYKRLFNGEKLMRKLKCIVREWQKTHGMTWTEYMAMRAAIRQKEVGAWT